MEKSIKNKLKKTAAVFLAAALIFICLPFSSFASGSYYTSVSSMTLTQGASSSFTFGATNAVGAFEISTDGGVSASYSGEKWVDNSSVTISVTGNTVGTGHVYISVYDGADYDGNDLSGKSYTVTVTVKASTTTQTTTTATTTTAATTTTTATTTQETTEDPELELLSVTVDDTQMYVVKDISGEDLPDGFEIQEIVYNTVTVQVMVFDDVVLYILENESGQTGYYTCDEKTGEFEALKYTTLSGKFCIFLDIPETLEIPYGYSVVETEICGFTVEALAVEADEEETEAESEAESDTGAEAESDTKAEAEIKAFFTVGETSESADADEEEVIEEEDTETGEDDTGAEETSDGAEDITSIDQMVASSSGHYYVYCLLGEEKVLCDYDSEDDILQRCAAIVSVEEETAEQAQTVAEDTEEEDIDINLILLIDVIIACVIIVILAVVLIIVLVVKKKNKVDPEFVDDIDFEEEDIFFGEEADQGADGSGFDTDKFFKEHIEGDINIEEGDAEEEPQEDFPGEGGPEDDEPETAGSEADGQGTEEAEDKKPEEDAEEETGASEEKDAGPAPEDDLNIEDITEILSEEFDKMLKEEGEL